VLAYVLMKKGKNTSTKELHRRSRADNIRYRWWGEGGGTSFLDFLVTNGISY
jgi:hypothetical protein